MNSHQNLKLAILGMLILAACSQTNNDAPGRSTVDKKENAGNIEINPTEYTPPVTPETKDTLENVPLPPGPDIPQIPPTDPLPPPPPPPGGETNAKVGGWFDLAYAWDGQIWIKGWACRTGSTSKVPLHIYADIDGNGVAYDADATKSEFIADGETSEFTNDPNILNFCKTSGGPYRFTLKLDSKNYPRYSEWASGKPLAVIAIGDAAKGVSNAMLGGSMCHLATPRHLTGHTVSRVGGAVCPNMNSDEPSFYNSASLQNAINLKQYIPGGVFLLPGKVYTISTTLKVNFSNVNLSTLTAQDDFFSSCYEHHNYPSYPNNEPLDVRSQPPRGTAVLDADGNPKILSSKCATLKADPAVPPAKMEYLMDIEGPSLISNITIDSVIINANRDARRSHYSIRAKKQANGSDGCPGSVNVSSEQAMALLDPKSTRYADYNGRCYHIFYPHGDSRGRIPLAAGERTWEPWYDEHWAVDYKSIAAVRMTGCSDCRVSRTVMHNTSGQVLQYFPMNGKDTANKTINFNLIFDSAIVGISGNNQNNMGGGPVPVLPQHTAVHTGGTNSKVFGNTIMDGDDGNILIHDIRIEPNAEPYSEVASFVGYPDRSGKSAHIGVFKNAIYTRSNYLLNAAYIATGFATGSYKPVPISWNYIDCGVGRKIPGTQAIVKRCAYGLSVGLDSYYFDDGAPPYAKQEPLCTCNTVQCFHSCRTQDRHAALGVSGVNIVANTIRSARVGLSIENVGGAYYRLGEGYRPMLDWRWYNSADFVADNGQTMKPTRIWVNHVANSDVGFNWDTLCGPSEGKADDPFCRGTSWEGRGNNSAWTSTSASLGTTSDGLPILSQTTGPDTWVPRGTKTPSYWFNLMTRAYVHGYYHCAGFHERDSNQTQCDLGKNFLDAPPRLKP